MISLRHKQEEIVMEEILCWRDKDGVPQCNIRQAAAHSSLNGLNWSSEGSGQAIFAKNVLELYVDHTKADKYYEDFMRDFVIPLPESGGKILKQEILEWLKGKGENID